MKVANFPAPPVVLVGGGIGVTPLVSMASTIVHQRNGRQVYFFAGFGNGREQPFREHLAALHVFSQVPRQTLEEVAQRHAVYGLLSSDGGQNEQSRVETPLLEFLVEQRFINGKEAMVIDLDRCTRCDDCVRACAVTHDNNPRFLRHGHRHGSMMVAHACMHCVDPVCMIGCPTGAIHRDPMTGVVRVNDVTCIGCSTCANSCPYDNIRMAEVRDASGALVIDEQTNQPLHKAPSAICASIR